MADQDPPIEPLRRIDPSEPDEEGLGVLERLDPDAEDRAQQPQPSRAVEPPSGGGSRKVVRDGVAAAIALAVLLSMSSIAAIGGLVAVSMRTFEPDRGGAALGKLESTAPLPAIRIGENARGPQPKPERERRERQPPPAPAPQTSLDEVSVPPSPVGAGEPSESAGGGRGDDPQPGPRTFAPSSGGTWCDTRPGASCDATPTGGQPASPPTELAAPEDDDAEDGDDPHPPGNAHGLRSQAN